MKKQIYYISRFVVPFDNPPEVINGEQWLSFGREKYLYKKYIYEKKRCKKRGDY